MSTSSEYYQVAVNYPIGNSLLTYESGGHEYKIGQLVNVPLGRRSAQGCIVSNVQSETIDSSLIDKIKGISGVYEDYVPLSEKRFKLFQWLAKYYAYPLGKLIFEVFPKAGKHIREPKAILPDESEAPTSVDYPAEHLKIIDEVSQSFETSQQFLVHGITGSGKSFVYLESIRRVLATNKSALLIVPEINLTPQSLSFFSKFLNRPVYPYHSGMTPVQRYSLWKFIEMNPNQPVVVIGPRSAVFLPFENLGLIVIDEEHDPSLKQEDRIRYHARDVAFVRGSIEKFPILMGSATPSLETWYRATQLKGEGVKCNGVKGDNHGHQLKYFQLNERFGKGTLPTISLLGSGDPPKDLDWNPFNDELKEKMLARFRKGEQVIVFINRLGFSKRMVCSTCKHGFECKNCSLALTYFKSQNSLKCHGCDYHQDLPKQCSECGGVSFDLIGVGTEKVEEVLTQEFPEQKITRFDREKVTSFKKLVAAIDEFQSGKTQILLGTQMLSKGHNFNNVGLVVVLEIDNLFYFPDFRAKEKIYQLTAQVSGRAGRFGGESEVIIQTSSGSKLFDDIRAGKKDDFYLEELEFRKNWDYPPYAKLLNITFENKNRDIAYREALKFYQSIVAGAEKMKIQVEPPRPGFIEKRKNHYYTVIAIRSLEAQKISTLLQWEGFWNDKMWKSRIIVDRDPLTVI